MLLFVLLFVGLSAAGIYVVYDQFAGHDFSFDTSLINLPTIAGIIGLLIIYYLSDGLRLYYTLRALGHKIPFTEIMKLMFINLFFSNVTPMATGGGVAQVWYLQGYGVKVGHATAATTIRTVLAVVFIFSLTPVFMLMLPTLNTASLIQKIAPALILFVSIYLMFFVLVIFKTRWLVIPVSGGLKLIRKIHLISEKKRGKWDFKLRREITRFSRSFGEYLAGGMRWVVLSVLFTAVFLLSLFSFPALLMWGLDYEVNYWVTVGLMTVTTFIMYFAPTPGASGISEGVFGSFFSGILSGGHLVYVTILWRVLTIYLGMIVGLILLQRDIVLKQDWNED